MDDDRNILDDETNTKKENNKSNTFNIIIGISTLLIAIFGTTFAYFFASASSPENDVDVKSAYVSISYEGGTEIKASNLIPSTETIALAHYKKPQQSIGTVDSPDLDIQDEDEYTNDPERRCIDSNGREVCYVYQFTIESEGEEGEQTDITGAIKVNQNEFFNLSYVLYKVEFEQENGADKIDKFGHRVVSTYTPVEVFNNTDNNSDNAPSNPKYAIFEKPVDIVGSDGVFKGTTYPLACIFGYKDDYQDKKADEISRCKSYKINNKEPNTYQLVIWLEETNSAQKEQGLSFAGTLSIEVPTESDTSDYSDNKITGKQ